MNDHRILTRRQLLALLVQFGVAPRIVARQDLRLWHSVGSVMYALQWCCAALVLWRTLQPGAGALPPDEGDEPTS